MTNVIHRAHNSIDDGRHTFRACLAIKEKPHMELLQDELTEVCSEISHCEIGGSLMRRRSLGRARETQLTECIVSDNDVGFF